MVPNTFFLAADRKNREAIMQSKNLHQTLRRIGVRAVVVVGIAAVVAAAGASSARGIWTAADNPAQAAGENVANAPTTIVIVRHAEKATDDPRDPSLNDAGKARAAALLTALDGAEVSAVYATQFKRTQATGEPVAKRFGINVTVSPITGAMSGVAAGLMKDILDKNAGKTVLIVGHSNTVPELVKAFSGKTVAPLSEEDYDRLYLIVRPASGPARLFQTRYGAPGPK
jgi:phosphohistidine phosphatase SixA